MEKKIKVKLKPEHHSYLVLTGAGKSYTIFKGGEYSPQGFEISQEEYEKVFRNVVDVIEEEEVISVKEEIEVPKMDFKKSGERSKMVNKGKGE